MHPNTDILEAPNYHKVDPVSSRLAAARHEPKRPGNAYRVWFKLFHSGAELTALELFWRYDDYFRQHKINAYEIRRRLTVLGSKKNNGPLKAIQTGKRTCSCAREKATIWMAV